MSNEVEWLAAGHLPRRSATAQRPPRERVGWAQWAALIGFILCAAGLLSAVAAVAENQFNKGRAFNFADADDAPAPPLPYVSRGGTDVRELAPSR